ARPPRRPALARPPRRPAPAPASVPARRRAARRPRRPPAARKPPRPAPPACDTLALLGATTASVPIDTGDAHHERLPSLLSAATPDPTPENPDAARGVFASNPIPPPPEPW